MYNAKDAFTLAELEGAVYEANAMHLLDTMRRNVGLNSPLAVLANPRAVSLQLAVAQWVAGGSRPVGGFSTEIERGFHGNCA